MQLHGSTALLSRQEAAVAALGTIEDDGISAAAELVWSRTAGDVVDEHEGREDDLRERIDRLAQVALILGDPRSLEVGLRLIRAACTVQRHHDRLGDAAREREVGHRANAHGDVRRINHAVEVAVTGKPCCMACVSRRCVCGGAA